jgi:hypothetical protein
MAIAVLVTCAVGVACVVYFQTSNTEKTQFEEEFSDDSAKVFEALGSNRDLSLRAVDAFIVVVIVSFARFSNSTWPFVTVPDFVLEDATALLTSVSLLSSSSPSPWCRNRCA